MFTAKLSSTTSCGLLSHFSSDHLKPSPGNHICESNKQMNQCTITSRYHQCAHFKKNNKTLGHYLTMNSHITSVQYFVAFIWGTKLKFPLKKLAVASYIVLM